MIEKRHTKVFPWRIALPTAHIFAQASPNRRKIGICQGRAKKCTANEASQPHCGNERGGWIRRCEVGMVSDANAERRRDDAKEGKQRKQKKRRKKNAKLAEMDSAERNTETGKHETGARRRVQCGQLGRAGARSATWIFAPIMQPDQAKLGANRHLNQRERGNIAKRVDDRGRNATPTCACNSRVPASGWDHGQCVVCPYVRFTIA